MWSGLLRRPWAALRGVDDSCEQQFLCSQGLPWGSWPRSHRRSDVSNSTAGPWEVQSPPHTGVTRTHESHCGAGCDLAGRPWLLLADGSPRRYVQHYGLGEACDDVASVLKRVAVRLGKTQKVKVLTGTGETRGCGLALLAWLSGEDAMGTRIGFCTGRGSCSASLGPGSAGRPGCSPSPVATGGLFHLPSEKTLGPRLHRCPP